MAAAAVAVVLGALLAPPASASSQSPVPDRAAARFSTVLGPGTRTPSADAGLPTWTGSFTYQSTDYSYTMVGTSPGAGSETTTVPSEIRPLEFVFTTGTIDATSLARSLKHSPIFHAATFTSGTTQLADAMRRAEFWTTVSTQAPDYHLLLGKPTILPTLTINVPASEGTYYRNGAKPYGYVSYEWFVAEIESALGSEGLSPASLPVVLAGNVFLYQNGNESDCCVYGFHGAISTSAGELTFTYGNYLSQGLVGHGRSTLADIFSLSHEVSEWMDDPFVDNIVPRWVQPGSGVCFSDLLEGGDVVEALHPPTYVLKTRKPPETWHPSDIAGISWFAHFSPTTEQNGLYSYAGLLTSPSTVC